MFKVITTVILMFITLGAEMKSEQFAVPEIIEQTISVSATSDSSNKNVSQGDYAQSDISEDMNKNAVIAGTVIGYIMLALIGLTLFIALARTLYRKLEKGI